MKRRIFSIITMLALCLSLLPTAALATGLNTVYLDSGGNDNNSGAISDAPVKTFDKALELVNEGGTIIIGENGGYIPTQTGNELTPFLIDKEVTIQKGAGSTIDVRRAGIILGADVTFKDVQIGLASRDKNAIFANGHTLTLDNVTKVGGTRDIHLFAGSLVNPDNDQSNYTQLAGKNGGEIIIKGANAQFGNIYAGGMNTTSTIPATITIDGALGMTIGTIYASGALKGAYDGNNFLSGTEPAAPVANPEDLAVTGAVTINLGNKPTVTVDGATGGSSNATVNIAGSGDAALHTLTNIGSLVLSEGATYRPSSRSSLTNANVMVPAGSTLNLSDMDGEVQVNNYTGGGALVFEKEKLLSINGTVEGETSVVVSEAGSYIYAPNCESTSFSFAENSLFDFEYSEEDNLWSASSLLIPVASFRMEGVSVKSTAGSTNIPVVEVLYGNEELAEWGMDFCSIEFTVAVGDKEASYDPDEHCYMEETSGLCIYPAPEEECFVVEPVGDSFTAGTYEIKVTIPAGNTVGGAALTATATLTVTAEEPTSDAPTCTVSLSATPAESGTVSGAGEYNKDGSVTVTATPNSGYRFVKWTEGDTEVSTSASYTFTATGDRILVAVFEVSDGITVAWPETVTTKADPIYGDTWSDIVPTVPQATAAQLNGSGTIKGTTTLQDPAVMPNAGENTFTLVFTSADGAYTDTKEYPVTIAPRNINNATISVLSPLAYSGSQVSPPTPNSVTDFGGTKLLKEKDIRVSSDEWDYTVSCGDIIRDVGEYTLEINGYGNYTGTATLSFRVMPARIAIENVIVPDMVYNGGTAAAAEVQLAWDIYPDKRPTVDSLTLGTDYTVSAEFDDANVGTDKKVSVTVTLLDTELAKNFGFSNDLGREAAAEGTGNITKAPAEPENGAMQISNGHALTYAYSLKKLLPDNISDPGTVVYTLGTINDGSGYYKSAVVDGSTLILETNAVNSSGEGDEVFTIPVTITSTNYNFSEATIAVRNTNATKPEVTPQFSTTTLTYGDSDTLSAITIAATATAGELGDIPGTISWDAPDTVLTAGTHEAAWTFTPENESYLEVLGTAKITVNKAPLTIKGVSESINVNGTPTTPAYTVTGLVNGETLEDIGVTVLTTYWNASGNEVENPCDAGTYTVRVEYTGTARNYAVTTENGILTVGTPSSGGGGGGGDGGSSTPSTPTTSVTVPISGEESSIQVGATVKGDTVTVDKVDLTKLDSVIGDHVDTGTVTIDFSGMKSSTPITTVELPADVVKEIAAAVSDPANDAHSLEIVLSNGTSIEFDAAALGEKAAQAGGASISISIESHKDAPLTNAQKNAVGDRPAFDISVTSGGKHISDMGGKITIHAPYQLKPGEKGRGLVVWYVDENGKRERCETSYDPVKKRVNWKTDHLSLYMIDYDEMLAGNPFSDVTEDKYYFDAVLWALDEGITGGTTATTFSPDASCTRAQMAAFLWRAAGSPEPKSGENPFTDVKADAYYAKAVQWAYEQGITGGTSATTFSPDAFCTRAQMATFIYRNEQAKGGGFTGAWMFRVPFADAPEWAFEAIAWCYMKGITGGTTETTFSPDANCTRGQMVTFLYRYFVK